jgi:uncharacterized protein GlcG (DUF336 family)
MAAIALIALLLQAAPASSIPPSAPAAPARAPASAAAPYGPPLTHEQAERVLSSAVIAARRAGLNLSIAVVEPTGEPVAFVRMTGAAYASGDVAVAKARTAARSGRESRVLGEALAGGRLWPLAIDGALPVEGGVPIVVDGRTIGAVGVSGASALQDGDIARAAEAAAG